MNSLLQRLIKFSSVSVMSSVIAITPIAAPLAQADDGILQQIYKAVTGISNYIAPLESYQQQMDYTTTDQDGKIMAANIGIQKHHSDLRSHLMGQTNNVIANYLNLSAQSDDDAMQTPRDLVDSLSTRFGPDYPSVVDDSGVSILNNPIDINVNGQSLKTTNLQLMQDGSNDVNLSALIGPSHYDAQSTAYLSDAPAPTLQPGKLDHGLSYITYLSMLANPLVMGTGDSSSPGTNPPQPFLTYADLQQGTKGGINGGVTSIGKIQSLQSVQRYRLLLRTWAAMQSTALNSLYHMYDERLPVKGLGQESGMKENDASIMQVDEYLAKKRLNAEWYQDMASAPPATVNREMLYLLAEMRYEQFEQRMETERLNATMSALLLAAAGNMSQTLTQASVQANSDAKAAKDDNN